MWPVFSNVLSALACFLSILAVISAALSAIRVRELQDRKLHWPESRIKSLETSLTDTQDALEEVANRVKMMKVRSAARHVQEKASDPDPYTQPDEWRRAMNKRLADSRQPIKG